MIIKNLVFIIIDDLVFMIIIIIIINNFRGRQFQTVLKSQT